MTPIIGIGGKLQHGKDAVADYLVEEHGWTKLGMSDALAESLYLLNPWIQLDSRLGWNSRFTAHLARLFRRQPRPVFMRYQELADSVGYVHAKEQTEVRTLLQVLGTQIGRKIIDDSIWINAMERRVLAAVADGAPGVVVTGIRFPNEITAIQEGLGGELWWVVRPLAAGANAEHESENSVNSADFDRVIQNDGTLPELYQKIDQLVQ